MQINVSKVLLRLIPVISLFTLKEAGSGDKFHLYRHFDPKKVRRIAVLTKLLHLQCDDLRLALRIRQLFFVLAARPIPEYL